MEQLRLSIFNSKIKYYNLRIVPPNFVLNKVTEFKKQFEILFGKQLLSGSKPHITVATFEMNSRHEDLLMGVFDQLPNGGLSNWILTDSVFSRIQKYYS